MVGTDESTGGKGQISLEGGAWKKEREHEEELPGGKNNKKQGDIISIQSTLVRADKRCVVLLLI